MNEYGEINKLSELIIGCAYRVSNGLGNGFLEKVYENALVYELRKIGLDARQQYPVRVEYEGHHVGEYYADILIEDKVIVELKTVRAIDEVHMAQSMNYLRATGLQLCLLLNFYNPKVQIKRVVCGLKDS